MRFNLAASLSVTSCLAGCALSAPAKRQEVFNQGAIDVPVVGTVIPPGSTFNFSFASINYCESGYEPLTVYLLAEPPSVTNFTVNGSYGGFAKGTYLYQFGEYLINNFGLPPMNTPVPSTLVMPDASDFASTGDYDGATLYLAAIETYTDCPPDITYEYGMTSNAIIFGNT